MMSGELEFEDIFYGDVPIQFPVTSHGMFFAFVLLVTIILTNLLVGLAVSDIQGLQASAGLDRLTRQAELVGKLESLFFSKLLRKAPSTIIRMCQQSALLRTSRYHLQFSFRPNDPRDKRLPKELALNIYKLVAERRDRNISIKRRRREHNMSYFTHQLTKANVEDGVFLRNHITNSDVARVNVQNRPQSVNTNQYPMPAGQMQNFSSNFLELDKKMRSIKFQMNELSNKLDNMQSILSYKLDEVKKECNFVKADKNDEDYM